MICDASYPTFLLTHWARDRHRGEKLPLEYVVRKQSRDTPRSCSGSPTAVSSRSEKKGRRQRDRHGCDDPACAPDGLRTCRPEETGSCRVPHGYSATIVNGVVTRRGGVDTGGASRPVGAWRAPERRAHSSLGEGLVDQRLSRRRARLRPHGEESSSDVASGGPPPLVQHAELVAQ